MFKPHHLCATLALVALAGCSSTPPAANDPEPRAIAGQRLSSQFQREGIKVEFECRSRTGIIDRTCVSGDITAIEVTGYANSFGNSEANRENAFAAAQDEALESQARGRRRCERGARRPGRHGQQREQQLLLGR